MEIFCVKAFFCFFNHLMMRLQACENMTLEDSSCQVWSHCLCYSALSALLLLPQSWQPWPEVVIIMVRWQRLFSNCFRFFCFFPPPHSAAGLLLFAALVAAIGSAACVLFCLTCTSPALQRAGQTVQPDPKPHEAHPRAAGEWRCWHGH